MARKVIWASSARDDLKSIVLYIAQHNPAAAKNFGKSLIEKSKQIERQSFSGRVVPEFQNPDLRELLYKPYRMIYRLKEDRIEIVRVWHSARGKPSL